MTDAPLSSIGKYQLTDVLGQGAMGVVYRALDPMLGRYVALKLMSHGIAGDGALRDRFMREARAAGSLQHPNIITIFDFGDVGGHLYIAMEYIEGADLSEIIERRDPLPLTGKLDIIIDVLHALDYAHARGVVHRDIKPANIRVSTDGRAKLMDFGIARLESSELTKTGMLIGTPHYMAPEQVSGGTISPATDVFALGVVLYEFLTYTKAFAGDSLTAVLYQVVSAEPPSFTSVSPSVPPALQSVVQRALAKDPAARYASAGEMARALESVRTALSAGAPVTIHARRASLQGLAVQDIHHPPVVPELPPQKTVAEPPATHAEKPARGFPLVIAASVGAIVVLLGVIVLLLMKSNRPPQIAAATPATPPAAPAPAAAPQPAPPVAATPGREARPSPAAQSARPAPAIVAPSSPAAITPQPAVQPPAPAPAPVSAPVPPPAPVPPQPAASQPPVPPPAAPVDHRPAIEQLIGQYARAIEARSVDQIRRVYPGLTSSQESGWQQFFASVRGIRTRLAITELDVDGTRATLAVAGSHEFESGGRQQRQPVSFRAVATLDGDSWRLVTIR